MVGACIRWLNFWRGTRVRKAGRGHRVAWSSARAAQTIIQFTGEAGTVVLGRRVRLRDCDIQMRGTAPKLVIENEVRLTGVRIVVEDKGSEMLIRTLTSMSGARLQSKEGRRVEIGANCMIGHGAEVTNSDSHSVISTATGERLNPARDVILENQVWLGANVYVGKGVRIGKNTVVAACSRVLEDLPPSVLAAGTPATVKRTGIKWARERIGVEF